MRRRWILAVLALVGLRAVLPLAVRWGVSGALRGNPEYAGHLGDVDLHLWRGAYSVRDLWVAKASERSKDQAFIQADRVDLSVSWGDLLRGQVVSRVRIEGLRVNFVDRKDRARRRAGEGVKLDEALKRLMPFKISRFSIRDGEVHFRNPDAAPPVDLALKALQLDAENLTNARKGADSLFAEVRATAVTTGDGRAELTALLNPTAPSPTFDLNAKVTGLRLKDLNPFLRAYGRFDFEEGSGDIVLEAAAADGKVKGYVKPLFKGVRVLAIEREVGRDRDSIFRIAWESIVGSLSHLLRNGSQDLVATRIPIRGSIDRPQVDVWSGMAGVLRNAFVASITPYYDRTLSLRSVGGAARRSPPE